MVMSKIMQLIFPLLLYPLSSSSLASDYKLLQEFRVYTSSVMNEYFLIKKVGYMGISVFYVSFYQGKRPIESKTVSESTYNTTTAKIEKLTVSVTKIACHDPVIIEKYTTDRMNFHNQFCFKDLSIPDQKSWINIINGMAHRLFGKNVL